MRRTLKNVQRLQWFCFVMWLYASALILWLGKLAADGVFAEKIALGFVFIIISLLGWVFWFIGFDTYMEIEQELRDKEEVKR